MSHDGDILRRAENLIMDVVIDLHHLAGHADDTTAVVVAAHVRAAADKLHDLAMELRSLAQAG